MSSLDLPPPPSDAPYRNSALSVDERVEDLLSRMSLEEKVGQMALVEKNSIKNLADVSEFGIGGILSGAGGKPENNTPEGWRDMANGFVKESKRSRLGIPVLYGVDANHGHGNVPGATIFPHSIGLGATGNVALVEAVAKATGAELRSTGILWNYAPSLDLPEDIRWGRTYEAFSSDPALTGQLGAAFVRGLQGKDQKHLGILATPKHFIGLGSMEWDKSMNNNFRIDQGVTPDSERNLRDVYLPPFSEVIEEGALSVMVGLNTWGDTKISGSSFLINDVLKGELNFKGFVVSDWYGVYELPGGHYQAAVTGINAGVDMVMLPFNYREFVENVVSAVRRGDISEERIDDAVRRILSAKFALGLFDRATAADLSVVGSESHRALAREAVAQSVVLLKNERGTLPLTKEVRHIRVAGSAADNIGMQSGGWTVEWQGIDGNWLPGATSILQGIRDVAGDIEIEFDKDGNFNDVSRVAEVGIAVVGEAPYAEGWGDNPSPSLSDEDLAIIKRLQETSNQVVVVIVSGRPLLITEHIEEWDALVAVWLPGSEGAGVADVLFGRKPTTGTLPLAWPANAQQLPIASDGVTKDGSSPLFPRYFGLKI